MTLFLDPQEVEAAVATRATEYLHHLRKLPRAGFEAAGAFPQSSLAKFRELSVALAASVRALEAGALLVTVRAFVPPIAVTRFVHWAAFLKFPDDTWSMSVPADEYELARDALDAEIPEI